MEEELDKRVNKKEDGELQDYLQFRRRGSMVPAKKGKGSFKRKPKHPNTEYDEVGAYD